MAQCKWCGLDVPPTFRRKSYCSETCHTRAWRARQPVEYHKARTQSEKERWRKKNPHPPKPVSVPGERWLSVVGYEGLYEVSSLGRVKSLAREYRGRDDRLLQIAINKKGYSSVRLYGIRGEGRRIMIHRLVLEAFIGPRPRGREGCHKDGDKQNNSPENLYWGTHAQNMQDMVAHRAARKAVGA